MQSKSVNTSFLAGFKNKLTDYSQLFKFRLTMLVLFSAIVPFLYAGSNYSLLDILMLGLAGFLVTAASNALNQIIEKDNDLMMKRTHDRPLPTGRMTIAEALILSGLSSFLGIIIFVWWFNETAAWLAAISLILYAFLYTPLKRISPIAVFVGAFPGALPVLIGWVAAKGSIGAEAMTVFMIQFLWQFPHFWAIAWVGFDDYHKAGYNLLPSLARDKSSAFQCVMISIIITVFAWVPYLIGMLGITSTIGLTLLGLMFVRVSYELYQTMDNQKAKKLMYVSFVYLPIALLLFLVDKII